MSEYLKEISLRPGESLPPGYSLVKAGRGGQKVAVVPRSFLGTYGRFGNREDAIDSAWERFGFTRAEWSEVIAACEEYCLDSDLLDRLRPVEE